MWSLYSISPMWLYSMVLRHRGSCIFNATLHRTVTFLLTLTAESTENISQYSQTSDLTGAPSCLLLMLGGGVSSRSYVTVCTLTNLSLSFSYIVITDILIGCIHHCHRPLPISSFQYFLCPCQRTLQSSCYHSI
jgi:hypothetical protein